MQQISRIAEPGTELIPGILPESTIPPQTWLHEVEDRGADATRLLTSRGWFRLGLAFLQFGCLTFVVSQRASADSWWIHGLWCIGAAAMVAPVFVKALRARFTILLRDHRVVFAAAFTLYFIFGASLLAFGPQDQIADALRHYRLEAGDALRMDALNAIGFGLALMTSALRSGQFLGRQADRVGKAASRLPAPWAMLILMLAAGIASFRVLLFDFAFREEEVSGVLRAASQFALVAIFLGSSYRGRREWLLRGTAILIVLVEAVLGVLLFSKSAVLLPISALIAGLALRFGVRRILPPGIVVLAILLGSLGGAVNYGRTHLDLRTPYSLQARWDIFWEGVSVYRTGSVYAPYNTWGRLCYLPTQAAAYDFYNAGMGGSELELVPWVFIPRAIAPSKPTITQVGRDFNRKITGSATSSSGMGVFSSGYYNGGWLGAIFVSVLCGWLLSQTSAIATAILRRNAVLLLPFALIGVYMAFRIQGHFVADWIATFVIPLYVILFLSAVLSLRPRRI